jgi:DNA-binding MarR family transcriptional regulator
MDRPQDNLGRDLLNLTLTCRKADRRIALSADMSVDELHCLIALHGESQLPVKELYETLGLSSTRMSKIFHSLEERGYLKRTSLQADRRKEEVALTEAGRQLARIVLSASSQVARELFPSLSKYGGPLFSYMAYTSD